MNWSEIKWTIGMVLASYLLGITTIAAMEITIARSEGQAFLCEIVLNEEGLFRFCWKMDSEDQYVPDEKSVLYNFTKREHNSVKELLLPPEEIIKRLTK